MRWRRLVRIQLGLAVAVVLVFAVSAGADTLTTTGNWSRASNWSEGTPKLSTPVLVPAGKEANVKSTVESGPLTVDGRVSGIGSLKVAGSIHVSASGAFNVGGMVSLVGFSELWFGGEEGAFDPEGFAVLEEPLSIGGSMNARRGSILMTDGWPVYVKDTTYPLPGSTTLLGTSVWTTSTWLEHSPGEVEFEGENATVVIVGPGRGTFRGLGWSYGDVTLADPEGAVSRSSYTVLGALTLDSPYVGVEGGTTVTAGSLASDATAGHPVRVEAAPNTIGEQKGEATIVCGCTVPPFVELVGVKVV